MRKQSVKKTLLTVSFIAMPLFALSPAHALTRGELLKGCEIPDRRPFPLDPKVPACTNFYDHVCDGVISSFKLRDDRSTHTFAFNDSHERMLHAKKTYLKKLRTMKDLSPRAQQLQNVFNACIDEKAGKIEEPQWVQKEASTIQAIQTRDQFLQLVGDRIDSPETSFLSIDEIPNQDDPLQRDLLFDVGLMTLPERTYYDKADVMKDFETLVTDFFKTLKMDNPTQRAASVVAFEKAFAQKYPLPEEFRELITQRRYVDRAAFAKSYPNLKTDAVLHKISKQAPFRDLMPETFAYLNQTLQTAPVETLKNVLAFHSIRGLMDDAYPDFFKKQFEFNRKHMGGPEKRPVREERCTMSMMRSFARELDAELLPVLFPDFSEAKVVALAEKVRSSLVSELQHNQWLSPEGKQGAIKKIKNATLLLVKPHTDDEWDFNPKAEYSPKTRIQNSRTLKTKLLEKSIREYGEKRNRTRWLMGPLTINAYYMSMDNVFVLPIGILQYPFYDPSLPDAANIAAIGSVIGHELGHSIDDKGSKFDESGKLHQWMTEKDLQEFQARGGRFVERFNRIGHNGTLTLGENIGDHVGITAAFQAAFGSTPAADVKPQAMKEFFYQYGRSWCQVMRPKYREMLLKTDPHASGEARVNEQVRHLDAFPNAFGCKSGDAMYLEPKERIKVW